MRLIKPGFNLYDINEFEVQNDNIVIGIGDIILSTPGIILSGIAGTVDIILDIGNSNYAIEIIDPQPYNHLFLRLLTNLATEEQSFILRYNRSLDHQYIYDKEDIYYEQRKVLWDAVKNTYISKYKSNLDNTIHNTTFYIDKWKNIDFVVMPPLLIGYVYYRGIDKKITIDNAELRVSIEPINKLLDGDLSAAAGIELSVIKLPIKLLLLVGLDDNNLELEFIGIGTDIFTAKSIKK
jgi:hypothetical protein